MKKLIPLWDWAQRQDPPVKKTTLMGRLQNRALPAAKKIGNFWYVPANMLLPPCPSDLSAPKTHMPLRDWAKREGIGYSWASTLIRNGALPCIKVGSKYYIRKAFTARNLEYKKGVSEKPPCSECGGSFKLRPIAERFSPGFLYCPYCGRKLHQNRKEQACKQ